MTGGREKLCPADRAPDKGDAQLPKWGGNAPSGVGDVLDKFEALLRVPRFG